MKKFLMFVAAAALSVMVIGVQAQKPSPGKMGGKMAGAPGMAAMAKPAAKGVTGTSKGTVKGTPTAKSFMLTTDKGDKTVDTSSAKFRNAGGQFVKGDKLTSGAMVEATGTWKGKTLVASSIKITSLKADKPAGGKMSGGKMGAGKMNGSKM